MSVREEDRQKNCPGRRLRIAAVGTGVGVGSVHYYFSNRNEQPDAEGSTTNWACDDQAMQESEDQTLYTDSTRSNSDDMSETSDMSFTDMYTNEEDNPNYSHETIDSHEINESQETSGSDEINESQETSDSHEINESQVTSDSHEINESQETSDNHEINESQETSDSHEINESQETSDSHEINESQSSQTSYYPVSSVTSEYDNENSYMSMSISENSTIDSFDMIMDMDQDDTELDSSDENVEYIGTEYAPSLQNVVPSYRTVFGDILYRSINGLINYSSRLTSINNSQSGLNEEIQRQANLREQAFRKRSWAVENCSICFEAMTREHLVLALRCTHRFHEPCILPWLRESQTCPNCRKDA